MQLAASVVVVHGLIRLVALGPSPARDRTHVPFIGGWILVHRIAREILNIHIFYCIWFDSILVAPACVMSTKVI